MFWYWKVRIYSPNGNYAVGQIRTEQGSLDPIHTIQEFYTTLTGCKMLLEGMSEHESAVPFIHHCFKTLFKDEINDQI